MSTEHEFPTSAYALTNCRTCNFTDHISVLVGPNEQPFLVHKDMICAKSKFFKAACSEHWVEGEEKKVRLPEVDPSVFQGYLSWVYSTSLSIVGITTDGIDKLSGTQSRAIAQYLELYLLGDVLDDISLRNKVLQTIVLDTRGAPNPRTVVRAWEKTPFNSPVRRMLVDHAVLRTQRAYLADNLTRYPEGFVQQVAIASLQQVPTKNRDVYREKLNSYLEPAEQEG